MSTAKPVSQHSQQRYKVPYIPYVDAGVQLLIEKGYFNEQKFYTRLNEVQEQY